MQANVLDNIELAPHYYRLSLHCPPLAHSVKPGQFVMLKVSQAYDPLLRRPFSIHRVDGELVQILYQVVGKGTKLMSQLRPGEALDVLGPLGNGFGLQAGIKQAILVGGGVGVAPLLFWAQELGRQKIKLLVFVGGKNRVDLLALDDFRQLGARLYLATEDGTAGYSGRVTDIVADYLSSGESTAATAVFACGPKGMLAHIAGLAERYVLPCQLSLDVVMACGVGACMGCVVKSSHAGDYIRVCKEGPVFEAARIAWA